MSVASSVILTVTSAEDGYDVDSDDPGHDFEIKKINTFLKDFAPLAHLTPHFNGNKHPRTETFGGGYNGFPNQEFIAYLETLEWQWPENVVCIIQPEEGDTIVWRPSSSAVIDDKTDDPRI